MKGTIFLRKKINLPVAAMFDQDPDPGSTTLLTANGFPLPPLSANFEFLIARGRGGWRIRRWAALS